MTGTIAEGLARARSRGIARLDAQVLMAHATGRTRSWVIANDQSLLDTGTHRLWSALMERRAAGEPLAYLTGEREFHGLVLHVTPDVLIPRPDTELLVSWAIELIDPRRTTPMRVLDLGTGSGAIALALKQARPECQLTAIDISPAALQVASANGTRLDLPVRWLLSDGLAALAGETFELIVANLPYVADQDPHLADLRHEPQLALTSGPDGLDAIRSVVPAARAHLSPPGWLLLEHGRDQATEVSACLRSFGYQEIQTRADLAGHPRCTGARSPAR
ncbi:MAG TPA: peptide chain release factor N(5)-glutamine methyltransferase [Burkholderiaceae bacterium]|nr:peptide chain release factor N(5)-glutamine methyltransferase [Burkholderiaceae bacterium]